MNIFEQLVVQPIFNLLLGLYSLIGDFGIAVILFTIVVRFALWPLVVKQLHQVKAMRKLQPELVRIKKEAKGNKQLEGMQMLELYKKHGVKPFRSILMLFIQLPIFIALYQVIQIFTSHRDHIEKFTYEFMKGLEPVAKLIENPDIFNRYFLGLVDITGHAISTQGISIFLVFVAGVAAYTQYLMSKQTNPQGASTKRLRDVLAEAGDGKNPDQSEVNAVVMGKMIKVLPVFMFIVTIGLPGGVGLYYATSNLFAVIQQHFLLKKDTEELEKIAEGGVKSEGKKATAKARARQAREANVTNITRITAKDTRSKKETV